MYRTSLFLVILFTCHVLTGQLQKLPIPLQKKQIYSSNLQNSTSKKLFSITADSSQFIVGSINQQTVDAVVSVYNPEKELVQKFDKHGRGDDFFTFTTHHKGTYILEVSSFKQDSGKFSIKIIKNEPLAATPAKK